MKTTLKWTRKFPDSANNFDLVLNNPAELDSERMNTLLTAIVEKSHRKLSLSSYAVAEFRRWIDHPETPLKSMAYVLLSNWFMTQSGDRHSEVASRCEEFWDALFPCRPAYRLSSPAAGHNHVMLPQEFQPFWQRLSQAQGENVQAESISEEFCIETASQGIGMSSDAASVTELLRAKFDKDGVHCEVEGSSRAVADFLKRVSG